MQVIDHEGLKIVLDDEGFLVNPDDWNERVAYRLAEREGIEQLTEDMMDVIVFLREYYKKYNTFPVLQSICKSLNQPEQCIIEQFIDPIKAWKIAGLPQPARDLLDKLDYYSR